MCLMNCRCQQAYPYTLEEAQDALKAWKDALTGVSTAQSYKIGTRELTRANMSEIKDMIDYFWAIVRGLTSCCCDANSMGIRARRNIPTDR